MKASLTTRAISRQVREVRRNLLLWILRLPDLSVSAAAWMLAIAYVLWKRGRVMILSLLLLGIYLIGTLTGGRSIDHEHITLSGRAEKLVLAPTPATTESKEGFWKTASKELAASQSSIGKLKGRRKHIWPSRVEIVSSPDALIRRILLPKTLANRESLLERCGIRTHYELGLVDSDDEIQAMDVLVSANENMDLQRMATSADSALNSVCANSNALTEAYECYNEDKLVPCNCPVTDKIQTRILSAAPQENVAAEKQAVQFKVVKRSCYRSLVHVCTTRADDSKLPACGRVRNPAMRDLNLEDLLQVADEAIEKLKKLVGETIDKPTGVPYPPENEQIEIFSIDKEGIAACRVGPICRDPSGNLILPSWMKSGESELVECGFNGHLRFADSSEFTDVAELDLFGLEIPKYLVGEFLERFIGTFVAFEAANPVVQGKGTVKRLCIHHNERRVCSDEKLHLSPQLFLPDSILEEPSAKWLLEFIRALPLGTSGPSIVPLSRINQSHRSCFRSAVIGSSRQATQQVFLTSRNSVFSSLGISRDPILGAKREQCEVRVRFFWTQEKSLSEVVLRFLGTRSNEDDRRANSADLVSSSDSTLARSEQSFPLVFIFLDPVYDNRQVAISHLNPLRQSLTSMIQAMQKTDVLLGSHSEDLAILMFLRQNSVVVEASPFGYAAGPYEDLSKLFGLEHVRIHGLPDRPAFTSCLMSKVQSTDLTPDDAAVLVGQFDKALQSATSVFVPEGFHMSAIRKCLLSQNLELVKDSVANSTMLSASKGCIKK